MPRVKTKVGTESPKSGTGLLDRAVGSRKPTVQNRTESGLQFAATTVKMPKVLTKEQKQANELNSKIDKRASGLEIKDNHFYEALTMVTTALSFVTSIVKSATNAITWDVTDADEIVRTEQQIAGAFRKSGIKVYYMGKSKTTFSLDTSDKELMESLEKIEKRSAADYKRLRPGTGGKSSGMSADLRAQYEMNGLETPETFDERKRQKSYADTDSIMYDALKRKIVELMTGVTQKVRTGAKQLADQKSLYCWVAHHGYAYVELLAKSMMESATGSKTLTDKFKADLAIWYQAAEAVAGEQLSIQQSQMAELQQRKFQVRFAYFSKTMDKNEAMAAARMEPSENGSGNTNNLQICNYVRLLMMWIVTWGIDPDKIKACGLAMRLQKLTGTYQTETIWQIILTNIEGVTSMIAADGTDKERINMHPYCMSKKRLIKCIEIVECVPGIGNLPLATDIETMLKTLASCAEFIDNYPTDMTCPTSRAFRSILENRTSPYTFYYCISDKLEHRFVKSADWRIECEVLESDDGIVENVPRLPHLYDSDDNLDPSCVISE